MPKWLWVGLLGAVLLAPAALYWSWIRIFDPVRPSDVQVAFDKLATVPLSPTESGHIMDTTVIIPSSTSWKRIIRNWGDPGYIIAAVSPGRRRYVYCLKDLGIHVQARIGDEPVILETAKEAPYGYSLDCAPAGLRFRAPQGATVQVRFWVVGHPGHTADLVVEPYWKAGTKDRLVGLSIQQNLHIRALVTTLGLVGLVTIVVALFLFLHRPVPQAPR